MSTSPRGKKGEAKSLMPSAIKCHCFNADCSQVAVVAATPDIFICRVEGEDSSKWQVTDTLSAHDLTITSLDWGKKTNRLLSCSEDRTAYVWERKGGKWEPVLVQLGPRCNRAALSCRWSPNENKFVIGTGAKRCHVCYYEESNDWWVNKELKGHKSSVTCVEWQPGNNAIIASASTDCTVCIWSAYLKTVDGAEGKDKGKLGSVLATHTLRAWVRDIAFSPDGRWLAAVAHDSTIHWIDLESDGYSKIFSLPTRLLPFTSVRFVAPDTCIAAGNDFYPICYQLGGGGEWSEAGKWMEGKKQEKKEVSAASKAMSMFQDAAKFGGTGKGDAPKTKHQNSISSIGVMRSGSGSFQFATAGLEGQLYVWKSADMQKG